MYQNKIIKRCLRFNNNSGHIEQYVFWKNSQVI